MRAKRPRAAAIPTATAPATAAFATAAEPTAAAPVTLSRSLPATPSSVAHIPSASLAHHSATVFAAPTPAAATLDPTAANSVALTALSSHTLTLVDKAAYVRLQLGLDRGMTLPQQANKPPPVYPCLV